jgi:hypothetical protein
MKPYPPPIKPIGFAPDQNFASCNERTFDVVQIGERSQGQVIPREDLNTYIAAISVDGGEPIELVSKPNGFSCKVLLNMIRMGNFAGALCQFDKITINDAVIGGKALVTRERFEQLLALIRKLNMQGADHLPG